MGVKAVITLPWQLVGFEAEDIFQTVERTVYDSSGSPVMVNATDEDGNELLDDDGNTMPIEKRAKIIMSRSIYTVTIKRRLIGIKAFGEEVGDERASWQLMTGADTNMNYTATGKKYVCTSDKLEMLEEITGEAMQTQTWLYMSKWAVVPDNKFTGA